MSFIAPFPGVSGLAFGYLDNVTGGNVSQFTGRNFGVPQAGRFIVAALTVAAAGGTVINSITIGGVPANLVVARTTGNPGAGGSHRAAAIAIAEVVSGSSGTVSFGIGGALNDCALTLYSIYGLQSAAAARTGSSIANSPGVALNVGAGGIIIAGAASGGLSSPGASWSNMVKDTDNAIGVIRHTSAHNQFSSAVNLSFVCNFSGGTGSCGAFAVFEP